MLDLFSGTHILILLAVALLVLGPKDLPRIMRTIGQWMGKARRMADEFKRSFDEMARQAELDKFRAELDAMRKMPIDAAPSAPAQTLPDQAGLRVGAYQAADAGSDGGTVA
jgi:sec-independent protein translocase protein TatB